MAKFIDNILAPIIKRIKPVVLRYTQDSLIFKPKEKGVADMQDPLDYGLEGFATHDIVTGVDDMLHLWQIPPENETSPTILVFHGNTGHFGDVGAGRGETHSRDYRIKLLQAFADEKVGVIAVSMRGYGKSTGRPSEEAFVEDIEAVLDYVLHERGISPDKLLLFGESLGAAIALIAAEDMQLRGRPSPLVVTIAAFHSMKKKAIELHPDLSESLVDRVLKHPFDNESRIRKLTKDTHILLLHPEFDLTTPPHHSEYLYDAACEEGLSVAHKELGGAEHLTWSAQHVAKEFMSSYNNHVLKNNEQNLSEKVKKKSDIKSFGSRWWNKLFGSVKSNGDDLKESHNNES